MLDGDISLDRRNALKVSIGSAITGLAGCLGSEDIPTISIMTTTPHNELAGHYFSAEYYREKGILEHYGESYEAEYTSVEGSPIAMSGLGADEAQIAGGAFSSAASAAAEEVVPSGFTILMGAFWVGPGIEPYYNHVTVSTEDSDITGPEDIIGGDMAVNARGTSADIFNRWVLSEEGITVGEDVTLREIGFGAIPDAVMEGRVDTGLLIQPFWYLHQDEFNNVFDWSWLPIDYAPNIMYCVRNDFLEDHEEALQDWVEDYWNAHQWYMHDGPRDEIYQLAADEGLYPDRDTAEAFINKEEDYYKGQNGVGISVSHLQETWDVMVEFDLIDEQLDANDYVDHSYLEVLPEEARTGPGM